MTKISNPESQFSVATIVATSTNASFPIEISPLIEAAYQRKLRALLEDKLPLDVARDEYTTNSLALNHLMGHRSAQIRRLTRNNRNTPEASKRLFNLAQKQEKLVPEELGMLAQGGRYAKELVARHPNTALSVLLELCHQGFGAVVATNTNAPEKLLWDLYAVPELRVFLAQNTKLPESLQEKLSMVIGDLEDDTDNADVRLELARNPSVLPNTLARLMADPDWEVREAVTQRPEMTPDWLRGLALDSWFGVREMVSKHARTPADALLELARDPDEDIRVQVAIHANLPVGLLEIYAKSPENRLRMAAAVHPNTSQEVLDFLAEDEHPPVAKLAALRDLETAGYELERAAKNKNGFYKFVAAIHPNTPMPALEQLSKSNVPEIRALVVAHPNATNELRQKLANDPESTKDVQFIVWALKLAEESHSKTGTFALDDARMRRAIAASGKTVPDWLETLRSDTDRGVLMALAQNENTPKTVLLHLMSDEVTRQLILAREDLPEAMDEQIVQSDITLASGKNTQARFTRLSRHPRLRVRGRVARNENAPEPILAVLTLDKEVQVRLDLLENPDLPIAIAKQLIRNDRFEVRQKLASKTTKLDFLIELAKDSDTRVLQALLNRTDTPAEALAIMARYQEPNRNTVNENQIYRAVAQHPNVSAEALSILARTKDPPTLTLVAQHKNTNAGTLENLFARADLNLQWEILVHPNVTKRLLETRVFTEFSFPSLAFWQLAGLQFLRRFKRTKRFAKNLIFKRMTTNLPVYRRIAEHPNTSAKILRFFADVANKDLILQELISKHPNN